MPIAPPEQRPAAGEAEHPVPPTPTIRAIETEYAGCRFRSRLEARWVVFFNKLDIEWQYEHEGFEFAGQRYLPDFYLPRQDIFVEVKGSREALRAVDDRLRSFSSSIGGHQFIVILGEVPDVIPGWAAPSHTTYYRGERVKSIVIRGGACAFMPLAAADIPETRAAYVGGITPWPDIAEAYSAARKARFEHGERG